MFALVFDLVALVYIGLGIRTAWRLAHEWRSLVDAKYTDRDRDLAHDLGFFFLTPLGVLVHELAHIGAARAMGAQITELHFRVYWGAVSYAPTLEPVREFLVAAAGPAASVAAGLVALALAQHVKHLWSIMLGSFAAATLGLTLILYPAMSYVFGFGDFVGMYTTDPTLSAIVGIVHVAALVAFVRAFERLTSRSHAAYWSGMATSFPDRRASFDAADAARLAQLEGSWQRFLPGVRQELKELRDLRDWIFEHNRQIDAAASTTQSSEKAAIDR